MRRQLTIALVITGIGLAGLTNAYAWNQRGGAGYYGNQMQNPGPRVQYNQVDPAAQEKLDHFFANTSDIRKEMAVKRAEKQALNRNTNTDPVALGKVEGELFDLHTIMRQKAEEAGVTEYLGTVNGPMIKRINTTNGNGYRRYRN
jgi:flavin-dependent dehydrogenase